MVSNSTHTLSPSFCRSDFHMGLARFSAPALTMPKSGWWPCWGLAWRTSDKETTHTLIPALGRTQYLVIVALTSPFQPDRSLGSFRHSHLLTNNKVYFNSLCLLLLPGARESSLLFRTYLIRSWSWFLEILPTTKIQLKFQHLQKTYGVHSFISSFSFFLPLSLWIVPSTASPSKLKHHHTQHMLFVCLSF